MLITRVLRQMTVLAAALVVALTGAAGAGTAAAQAGTRQLLYFNHAYGVFDRTTADAIEHSSYLHDFANFQVRTTTGSGGETWTGRYLLGHQTYLELFGIGDVPGQDGVLGAAGMGVSVEHSGELATVTQNLKDQGVEPTPFLQTRDFGDGKPVPWFDSIFTTTEYDGFSAWGMEYRPEYFADPRSNSEPASFPGDVGRERYLPDDYKDHLMRDVSAIRMAVTPRDLAATLPLLRAGGFAVRSTPHGGALAVGGGTRIRFDAVPRAQAGLRRIGMTLNHPVARHVERIGNSTLVVGPGARAVWTFAPNS